MKHTMQMLDIIQARQLVETAKGHPQEALFVLALVNGMRRSELLGLKWQDLDFEKKMLCVRRTINAFPQQGDREKDDLSRAAGLKIKSCERSLALTDFGINALKNHQVRQNEARERAGRGWKDLNYVFCNLDGSLLRPERDVLIPFKSFLQEAGLPNVRFYSLRQSVATFFFDLGVHPYVIQCILGIAEKRMSLATLSPVSFTMQQEAMERLSRLLEGAG